MKYYWMNFKTFQVEAQTIHESSHVMTIHPFLFLADKNKNNEEKEINVLSNWKEISQEEYEMIINIETPTGEGVE